jgi:hypothetical protein
MGCGSTKVIEPNIDFQDDENFDNTLTVYVYSKKEKIYMFKLHTLRALMRKYKRKFDSDNIYVKRLNFDRLYNSIFGFYYTVLYHSMSISLEREKLSTFNRIYQVMDPEIFKYFILYFDEENASKILNFLKKHKYNVIYKNGLPLIDNNGGLVSNNIFKL